MTDLPPDGSFTCDACGKYFPVEAIHVVQGTMGWGGYCARCYRKLRASEAKP